MAGRIAFQEAVKKAGVTLLEPIMRVAVTMPRANLGDIVGSLNARRAVIESIDESRGDFARIQGRVPLAEMFAYATLLRSMTAGRGTYTMEPTGYEPVPESMAREVIEAALERRAKK
jgi:elongation factor G